MTLISVNYACVLFTTLKVVKSKRSNLYRNDESNLEI